MSNPKPLPESRTNPIRLGVALRALWRLSRDNDDTTHVFEIVDALRGDSDLRNVERMRESEIGRAILAERRSLLDVLADRERLRALPDGSLGRVYLAFMEREGLTADGLAAAADEGYRQRTFDPDVRTFADWARDSHDLWHVLTGYGRDEAGESANLAFTYGQTRSRGAGILAVTAALIGMKTHPIGWPRYLYRAWRRGRRAAMLPVAPWEDLLPRPLALVRQSLGVEPPEKAHPEGIIAGNRGDDV